VSDCELWGYLMRPKLYALSRYRKSIPRTSIALWTSQEAYKASKPMPVEDSYIAAIARRHNLTVATGNVKDFQRPGVKVLNPFAESESS
jgi:predicted nucleic acid-binding protein